MVLMVPSAPTDFTMPMCSPQTIRSPGLGRPEPAGTARCACWAQDHTASTEPKPWIVAQRLAGLTRHPRHEVGAPRAHAGVARGGAAVLGDAGRVVRAGRGLGLA